MNLHPSPTARGWKRLGKTSKFYCGMCGFPRDANRGITKTPPRNVATGITVTGTFDDDDLVMNVAGNACPMCGTFRSDGMHAVDITKTGRGPRKVMAAPVYVRRTTRF